MGDGLAMAQMGDRDGPNGMGCELGMIRNPVWHHQTIADPSGGDRGREGVLGVHGWP